MIVIQLKPKKSESLLRFHPWVFSGAIQHINGKPSEGDLVEVQDYDKNFLAIGHYQIGSIAVRVISFKKENINDEFWKNKIKNAYQVRITLNLITSENNTYRLIHGEGDNLPGLIVDIYDNTAVLQAHSVGMHNIRKTLANAIVEVVPAVKNVFYKSESTLPYNAPIERKDEYIIGNESSNFKAKENNLLFNVDWIRGQKTGFFVDQRENRSLLEKYSKGKKVLNMFCYTGGFSVYALRGGASLVHSVDSSAKAVEFTDKNIENNFPNNNHHQSFTVDAFKFLGEKKEDYDIIILDPPAFAKHRDAVRNALKGYKRLNAKALEQIKPQSILFTFSCSQVITKDQFRLAVFSAAAEAKRNVRILHQLSQSADHPINIYHPEGEYLKGLVLFVE